MAPDAAEKPIGQTYERTIPFSSTGKLSENYCSPDRSKTPQVFVLPAAMGGISVSEEQTEQGSNGNPQARYQRIAWARILLARSPISGCRVTLPMFSVPDGVLEQVKVNGGQRE